MDSYSSIGSEVGLLLFLAALTLFFVVLIYRQWMFGRWYKKMSEDMRKMTEEIKQRRQARSKSQDLTVSEGKDTGQAVRPS
jgi:hypothetical protein